MRKTFLMGLLGFVVLGTVCMAAGDESEFRQIIDQYYEAWNTMKAESAARFYAKDAGIVFFDVAPMKYNGWNEYQEGAQKNFFRHSKDLQAHSK